MGLKASKYEIKKPEICLTCEAMCGHKTDEPYCLEHKAIINPCGICDEYEREKE